MRTKSELPNFVVFLGFSINSSVKQICFYFQRVFHFCCCCKACIEGWEPVEDEKPGALELGVQRRLAAHHMREQAEHRLMYFIANKLE